MGTREPDKICHKCKKLCYGFYCRKCFDKNKHYKVGRARKRIKRLYEK